MGGPTDRAAQILDRAHRQTAKVDADGTTYVTTYQDVEPHMEYAAKCRRADREHRGEFGKRKDMHRTMSLPFNIIAAAAQRLGIPAGEVMWPEHSKRIYKELKRAEFKAFRTTIDKRI